MAMNRTIIAALTAASLIALSACQKQAATSENTASENAAAPAAAGAATIDGTWKTDMSTLQLDAKPDQYLLKDGKFSCSTCTPPFTLAADGAMHAVDRPYADHMSVKVDDDHNVTRTNQKGGKTTGTSKYSVSADGNTLTVSFNDTSGTKPVTGSYTESRAAPAPAGAHAISGSWKQQNYASVSDEGLTVTFKLDGDTLHMSAPTGQTYDAKIGGPDVPIKGDIGGTMAAVTKNGDAIVETDKRGGKVISVTTMTPGADGKLHVVNEDKLGGSTAKFDMNKQ
jgi:type II secretory pathway pseudopilin PulG